MKFHKPRSPRRHRRRGSATVEFAIIAPLFMGLVMATVEIGSALSTSQTLYAALREAGRLASMDYRNVLGPQQDPNAKVIQDTRNFLTASGIPGDDVEINIVHAGGGNDGAPFELNNPDNDLKLFRIEARVSYADVSTFPMEFMRDRDLTAQLTFRKGKVNLIAD